MDFIMEHPLFSLYFSLLICVLIYALFIIRDDNKKIEELKEKLSAGEKESKNLSEHIIKELHRKNSELQKLNDQYCTKLNALEVEEAENLGFRRAYRWRGSSQ